MTLNQDEILVDGDLQSGATRAENSPKQPDAHEPPRELLFGLDPLSSTSRKQIEHVIEALDPSKPQLEPQDENVQKFISSYSQRAAVLVLLFEQAGALRVLLTTRAKTLRTHGGQTSLPGGKTEPEDPDIIYTAYREANEEVGLPLSSPHIRTLGVLEPLPFHKLLVTPVVALLSRPEEVLRLLRPSDREVDHIFSHPLEAIIDPAVAPIQEPGLVPPGENWAFGEAYHTHKDHVVDKLGGMTYRLHAFRTSASPITGFTADVLIRTAEIAYSRSASYERYAHDQTRNFAEMSALYLKFAQRLVEERI